MRELKEITGLGIKYNLLTAYTSFVAIDAQPRRQGAEAVTVKQPLPLPQGVSDSALPGQTSSTMAMANPLRLPPAMGIVGSGGSFGSPGAKSTPPWRGCRNEREFGSKDGSGRKSGGGAAPKLTTEAQAGPKGEKPHKICIESLKVQGGLSKETVRRVVEQNLPLIGTVSVAYSVVRTHTGMDYR